MRPSARVTRATRVARARWVAGLLFALAATPAAWAAPDAAAVECAMPASAGRPAAAAAGAAVRAAWTVLDAPAIVVGEHFALRVQACPADAVLVRVDASMPAHRHGMNYRPSIHPLGPGVWRVDGLMFHMRGAWELVLEWRHDGRLHALRAPVVLP